jgi:hypothetical protein
MALASAQKRMLPISRAGIDNYGPTLLAGVATNRCGRDAPAQPPRSGSVSWSGSNALLVAVRHSRIIFPSILNSTLREDVGRRAQQGPERFVWRVENDSFQPVRPRSPGALLPARRPTPAPLR